MNTTDIGAAAKKKMKESAKNPVDDGLKEVVYAAIKKACIPLSIESTWKMSNIPTAQTSFLLVNNYLRLIESDDLSKLSRYHFFSPGGLSSAAAIDILQRVQEIINKSLPYIWKDYLTEMNDAKEEVESLLIGLRISE